MASNATASAAAPPVLILKPIPTVHTSTHVVLSRAFAQRWTALARFRARAVRLASCTLVAPGSSKTGTESCWLSAPPAVQLPADRAGLLACLSCSVWSCADPACGYQLTQQQRRACENIEAIAVDL